MSISIYIYIYILYLIKRVKRPSACASLLAQGSCASPCASSLREFISAGSVRKFLFAQICVRTYIHAYVHCLMHRLYARLAWAICLGQRFACASLARALRKHMHTHTRVGDTYVCGETYVSSHICVSTQLCVFIHRAQMWHKCVCGSRRSHLQMNLNPQGTNVCVIRVDHIYK